MGFLIGVALFCLFAGAVFHVGTAILKIIFTLLSGLVGLMLLLTLIPLGIGLLAILLTPLIIIGVIVCIIKCLN